MKRCILLRSKVRERVIKLTFKTNCSVQPFGCIYSLMILMVCRIKQVVIVVLFSFFCNLSEENRKTITCNIIKSNTFVWIWYITTTVCLEDHYSSLFLIPSRFIFLKQFYSIKRDVLLRIYKHQKISQIQIIIQNIMWVFLLLKLHTNDRFCRSQLLFLKRKIHSKINIQSNQELFIVDLTCILSLV